MESRSVMALVLATAQVGCSIAFVKGRPDLVTPEVPPDCTTSMVVPGVEAAISVTAVATSLFLGLGAIAKEGDTGPGETNYLAWATLFTFLGGTVLAVDSGIGGFKVRRCRRAHEEHRALRNAPMLQPGYPPQGYPPPGYGQPPPPQMPPPGFERGACRIPLAQACEAGLACASGFCVRPPTQ